MYFPLICHTQCRSHYDLLINKIHFYSLYKVDIVNVIKVVSPLLQGLITLVDNHLCHLMLRPILPQLQSHIHDTSEKVRVAMVNLLLKVKGVRAIKV